MVKMFDMEWLVDSVARKTTGLAIPTHTAPEGHAISFFLHNKYVNVQG